MKSLNTNRFSIHQGFTLLEMLLALLILSIGLLGVAALQSRGQQFNYTAYVRTQAAMMAYEIMDRIRSNPVAVTNGKDYVIATTQDTYPDKLDDSLSCDRTAENASVNCSPDKIRDYDLEYWGWALAQALPGGVGTIIREDAAVCGTDPNGNTLPCYLITISWTAIDDDGDASNDTRSVIWRLWP